MEGKEWKIGIFPQIIIKYNKRSFHLFFVMLTFNDNHIPWILYYLSCFTHTATSTFDLSIKSIQTKNTKKMKAKLIDILPSLRRMVLPVALAAASIISTQKADVQANSVRSFDIKVVGTSNLHDWKMKA
jgi:hypothetical protein